MKRKLKSFLTSFIAALLLATLIVPIAACTQDNSNGGNTTVSVVSMGNKGLANVKVSAKSGDKTVQGTTNADGNVSLELDKSLSYKVTFDNLPKGYYPDPNTNYSITANSPADVKFHVPSKVITGESVDPTYIYKTGDVMYDFSFTTTKGQLVTLSEVLDKKKAVLINFWGSGCSNCQLEFPMIEKTYQMFKDDFSVMALDPAWAYTDTVARIESTLKNWKLELSFYYGLDATDLYKNIYAPAQNLSYKLPISVIIDRYGVVCEFILGSVTDEEKWQQSIGWYVSDDYVPEPPKGGDIEDIENFVPDKPADFDAKMSDPADIDRAINKTGEDILFYADEGEYSWPWVISSSGDSIVPLGSGHGRSYSMLYAELNLNTDQALLVDYKISSQEYYDQFAIIVDGDDLGRTTFYDSGNKGWQTALAYIPLTSGNHQILFVYSKGAIDKKYEDTVYLKNLRLVSTDSNEIPSSDISYYAARGFQPKTSTYNEYETVYLNSKDGYYHVSGRESAGTDPYLLLDMTHMIPYTRSSSFYEKYIREKNTSFGNRNYYNELMTYAYVSGNSEIEGMVPVTKELRDILIALCKHEEGTEAFESNPNMWLEFCVFFIHYGPGEAIDDPVKGLAYFSAYEAKLTDVYDTKLAQQQIAAIYQAQEKKAAGDTSADWDAIIKTNTDAYESNLATYNSVDFDSIFIPRGKVVKFTASEDGIYHFYSVGREDNPEYVCEAAIFGSDLKLHTALSTPVASHDSDTLIRGGGDNQFHLYHYLKKGESCYLNLMFFSTETIDTMYFAVNRIEDSEGNALPEYKTLKTVVAGFYTSSLDSDTMGQIYRPMYTKIELKGDYYYDTTYNHRIVVDFTELTRSATSYTLEALISSEKDVFNFEGFTLKIGDETIEGKDYTQTMLTYLAQAKSVGKDNPAYGLVEATKELRDILLLFTAKYDEIIVEEDWLAYCYFYEYFGADY